MKKVCVLVIILLAFISVEAQQLVDGERLDNIQIGKSTIYDVIANYGADYKLKKFSDYSNALVYEKLGLSFYSCQSDPKQEIFAVLMQSPFNVQTSKGIILGKSTFKELYKAYGKWRETSAGFDYEEIGLYFDTEPEVFEGFESDNMNFAQAKKTVIERNSPVRNNSDSENNNLINSSNSVVQSNNYLVNQNETLNNNTVSSNSKNKSTEKEEFKSEIDLWGNKIVNKIELIEKGRLRQCYIDFKTQN